MCALPMVAYGRLWSPAVVYGCAYGRLQSSVVVCSCLWSPTVAYGHLQWCVYHCGVCVVSVVVCGVRHALPAVACGRQ